MKKKILFLCVILFITHLAKSQEHLGNRFGIHTGAFFPNADFLDIYNNGFGGGLNAKFQISKKLAITANIGLYVFEKKFDSLGIDQIEILGFSNRFVQTLEAFEELRDIKLEIPSGHLLPVNIGIEYIILDKKIKPYLGASLGVYAIHTKAVAFNFNVLFRIIPRNIVPPTVGNGFGNVEFDATDLNFGGSGVLGCTYDLSDRLSLDLSSKYHVLIAPDREGAARFINLNFGAFYKF